MYFSILLQTGSGHCQVAQGKVPAEYQFSVSFRIYLSHSNYRPTFKAFLFVWDVIIFVFFSHVLVTLKPGNHSRLLFVMGQEIVGNLELSCCCREQKSAQFPGVSHRTEIASISFTMMIVYCCRIAARFLPSCQVPKTHA